MKRTYEAKLVRVPQAGCLAILVAFGSPAALAEEVEVKNAVAPFVITDESNRQLAGDTFALGDQLKVTVYENFAPSSTRPEEQALMSLVERSEISGTYVVQEDGSIFLPLVGAIRTEGLTVSALEKSIVLQFSSKLGANVVAAIQLVDREPVYVTGDLPQSGVFRYTPGMTALHAIALAGGSVIQGDDRWRQVDLAREQERIAQAQNRLARLLARMSVLIAEKGDVVDDARPRLAGLIGEKAATMMISEEKAVRDMERAQLLTQSAAATEIIGALEKERAILTESLTAAEKALKEKSERLAFMEGLKKTGVTTDQNLNIVRDEFVRAQTSWNDVRGQLARVERTLVEARHNDARVKSEYRVATERAFVATKQSITEEETTRALMSNVVLALRSLSSDLDEGAADGDARIEIVRRTPKGVVRMEADLLAPVRPGDILNVHRRERKLPQENATLVQ